MRIHPLPLLALPAAVVLLGACGGGGPGGGHGQAVSSTPSATVTVTSSAPVSSPSAPATSAAGTAPGTNTPAPPPTPGPSSCQSAVLTVSFGRADSGAGHSFVPLRFTNKSAAACLLAGFPGVSYVDGADHHQVGKAADRDTSRPVVPVTLAAGATGTATLNETNIGVYGANQCQPAPADALRVFPPGETHPAFVPLAKGTMGCAAPDLVVLHITPMGS